MTSSTSAAAGSHFFNGLAPATLFSMTGKVVLITGAAGGIGAGLARGFAAAGACLVLADLNDKVHALAEKFRDAGADAHSLVFDVTDESAITGTFDQIMQRYGRIDLEHDRVDRGRKLAMPVQALWGKQGVIASLFDSLADWREVAENVTGRALDCGHFVPEEAPKETLAAIERFLRQHPMKST